MDVAQLLHELALVADVAVVVALLPEDAAGSPRLAPKSGARTWATRQNRGANLGHAAG